MLLRHGSAGLPTKGLVWLPKLFRLLSLPPAPKIYELFVTIPSTTNCWKLFFVRDFLLTFLVSCFMQYQYLEKVLKEKNQWTWGPSSLHFCLSSSTRSKSSRSPTSSPQSFKAKPGFATPCSQQTPLGGSSCRTLGSSLQFWLESCTSTF